MRSSAILAGDGKDGEPGEDAPSERATDGLVGNYGASACTAGAAVGALPVVTVCEDGIESTGGYGGDGGLETGGDGAQRDVAGLVAGNLLSTGKWNVPFLAVEVGGTRAGHVGIGLLPIILLLLLGVVLL